MIRSSTRGPTFADALLKRVLPAGKRGDSILGDLREEFYSIGDARQARRWYRVQAVRLTLRYFTQPAPMPRSRSEEIPDVRRLHQRPADGGSHDRTQPGHVRR